MSTRSVVARAEGDGFRGRYVHSDGYPTSRGPTLWALIKRDGTQKVLKTIVDEHYGWSSLNLRDNVLSPGYNDDGRFVVVPGYGIAYTVKDGQSSPDEFITQEKPDWGVEWAWVLNRSALSVFVANGERWNLVEVVNLDGPEPDWAEIEAKG